MLCVAESLLAYFSRFGAVLSASVAKNRETGRNRGYGFVKFTEPAVTDVVLSRAAAEHFIVDGSKIDLRRARPSPFPSTAAQTNASAWHTSATHPTLTRPAASAYATTPVSAAAPHAPAGGYALVGAAANGVAVPTDAGNKVFIGGIDNTVTELTLRTHFSRYGEVVNVNIRQGKAVMGARAKPFAFLTFGRSTSQPQHIRSSTAQPTLAVLDRRRTSLTVCCARVCSVCVLVVRSDCRGSRVVLVSAQSQSQRLRH